MAGVNVSSTTVTLSAQNRRSCAPLESIHRRPARFHRRGPFRELARDQLGEIFRRPALRRRDVEAETLQALGLTKEGVFLANRREVRFLWNGVAEPEQAHAQTDR